MNYPILRKTIVTDENEDDAHNKQMHKNPNGHDDKDMDKSDDVDDECFDDHDKVDVMNGFPNTDNHPTECLYASASAQQSTQLHQTVKCENDYVSAKDNANENDKDVDEDFLDDDSNVDLMNVFQNTEDNPIEYIYTRDITGRVI